MPRPKHQDPEHYTDACCDYCGEPLSAQDVANGLQYCSEECHIANAMERPDDEELED